MHSFWSALCGPVSMGNIMPLEVTEVAHAFAEGFEKMGDAGVKQADLRDLARLLRADGKRPHRRPTQNGNQLPPPHSITSSARASTVGGIVRPSAFAVLRLMTSSNLVGCSTGRVAGLAPLRILSTYVAARLMRS